MRHPLLALADVHRLTTVTRGRTLDAYVFDHHRSAFAIWCHAARELGTPLTLVTLDRHMDLGTPAHRAPDHRAPLEALDLFARHRLAPSNDDHIVAAFDSGALDGAVVVARSHAPPSLDAFRPYRSPSGIAHPFAFSPSVQALGDDAHRQVERAGPIALDIDLDAFTDPSPHEVDVVVPWARDKLAGWLRPPGSEAFWADVLAKAAVVTIAREPYHCGGFAAGARLWLDFAEVFFGELLETDAP